MNDEDRKKFSSAIKAGHSIIAGKKLYREFLESGLGSFISHASGVRIITSDFLAEDFFGTIDERKFSNYLLARLDHQES